MNALNATTTPPPRYEEMRRHQRVSFEVAVNMESEHNFYAGITDNISEGGLFIATVDPPPIGAVIEIQISMPFREEPYWLRGEVRWHRPIQAARRPAAACASCRSRPRPRRRS
jgi:uncharacterized protein (TIGR02266 family)